MSWLILSLNLKLMESSRLVFIFTNSTDSSVGRALDWDGNLADSSLSASGVAVLYPSARHFICCLVLVQPRKTLPDMTGNLLTWMQKIKQTNSADSD